MSKSAENPATTHTHARSYAIVPLRYTIAYERAAADADALHSCFAPLHNCTEHRLNTIALLKPNGLFCATAFNRRPLAPM